MTNRAWRRARALRRGPDTGRRSRGAAGGCTVGGGVAPRCSAPKAPGQSAPARAPAKDAGLAPSLRCRSLCPTARLGDPLPSSQASGARPPTGQRRTLLQPQDTCRAQAAEWNKSAGFGGRGPRAHPAKAIQTIWEGSASPFTGPSLMRERLRARQARPAAPSGTGSGGAGRKRPERDPLVCFSDLCYSSEAPPGLPRE